MPNKRLNPLIQVGMAFLVLASIAKWTLHPHTTSGQDAADAVTGLLYGLSIGLMLFGLWKGKRSQDGAAPPTS
jgi:hypothetical protein